MKQIPHFPLRVCMMFALLLLAGTLPARAFPGQAQSTARWSTPELIYETTETIDSPYLISDAAGVTHLVWREYQREASNERINLETIFYMDDRGGDWGQAQDIIAMAMTVSPTIAVDSKGLAHLTWVGPGSTLFYSLAEVQSAATARGWEEPTPIAVANLNAQIVVASNDSVHVAYPGTGSSGVYHIRYDAEPDIWSSLVNVSPAAGANASADYARLAIGPDGIIHVVWTEMESPRGWPPTGVYYANSADGGESWSRPIELAGRNYVQGNVAVEGTGRIHVAWNGFVGVGGRYHRWSDDGGLTWSPVTAPVEAGRGGMEGPPQLAVDSGGTLHMLTTYGGCAYYLTWRDSVWSAPECISGREAMASDVIEQPALTITGGHVLHAVFWDDRERLWHTELDTGTPPLPSIELSPAATDTPEAETGIVSTPTVVASPTIDVASLPPRETDISGTPARSLLIASVAALVLLVLILLIKVVRSR